MLMKIILIAVLYYYYLLSKIIPLFLKSNPSNKSILFLENFPVENAGYQQRSFKWSEFLRKNGNKVQISTIIEDKKKYDTIRENRNQNYFLILALKKRFRQIVKSRKFSSVIVRRELLYQNDYGNLFLEKMLLKLNKNVILDFDDDLSAAKRQPKEIINFYGKLMLENGDKFNNTLKIYSKFITGSEYLKNRVNKQAKDKIIETIPTCVDTHLYSKKNYTYKIPEDRKINIGWIGSNQNLKYLDLIIDPLNKLCKEYNIRLMVISGKEYVHSDAKFEISNLRWSLKSQYKAISNFDIGIMPLIENEVSKGKCSFKLIQYMASGVISIGSDIGSNNELIQNGINGFLTENKNWYSTLKSAIQSWHKFSEISKAAVERILNEYSFESNEHKLLKLIK